MTSALVWFTFSLDEGCLLQSVRAARYHAPESHRIVVMDHAAPIRISTAAALEATGTYVLGDDTPRSGNLNGLDWVKAQLRYLSDAARRPGIEWAIKIDCDTLLNAQPSSWLQYATPDHQAVCAWQPKWWFQGSCYALRAAAPQALRDHLAAVPQGLPQLVAQLGPKFPEDVTTANLLTSLYGPASILALAGGSVSTLFKGEQIAHYNFHSWPAFEHYRAFRLVCFGNRHSLPPQMPDAVRRHTAARTMQAFLDAAGVPP